MRDIVWISTPWPEDRAPALNYVARAYRRRIRRGVEEHVDPRGPRSTCGILPALA